jgi:heat-inducible transcriptional repressor
MAELEIGGFLEKTHISSGRIPSEKGYRYYYETLMKPKDMNNDDMYKLQAIFKNQSLQLGDAILESMEIISELTNYTSVVLGKNSADNRLQLIEVVPINDNSIVAIVVTDKGHVENKQISFSDKVNINEIKQLVDLINKLLVGTPIDEVSSKLEYEIKPIIGGYIKQHEVLYDAFYNAFNEFKEQNMVFKGKNKFLDQPEFSNIDKVKNIINKFEDKDFVNSISEDSEGIKCYIGTESNIHDDVTVIKTNYSIDGKEGTIAIIGPKRMEYDRVVALLEYLSANIQKGGTNE